MESWRKAHSNQLNLKGRTQSVRFRCGVASCRIPKGRIKYSPFYITTFTWLVSESLCFFFASGTMILQKCFLGKLKTRWAIDGNRQVCLNLASHPPTRYSPNQVFPQSLAMLVFQAGYFFGRYIIMGWMGDTKPTNINKHFGGGITVHSSTVFVVESVFMCH